MENAKKKVQYQPSIPPKWPQSKQATVKAAGEAPYRALIGVVMNAKLPDRHPEKPSYFMRNQTGLTNRWRCSDSLYSDLLGSNQALKAVNFPFNQELVTDLCKTYPAINPMLFTCKEYAALNEHNWNMLMKLKRYHRHVNAEDDDDSSPYLPPLGK